MIISKSAPAPAIRPIHNGSAISNTRPEKVIVILNSYKCDFLEIGGTNSTGRIKINDVIDIDINKAKTVWENGLRDKLL